MLGLAIALVTLSFRVEHNSVLFVQLLLTGGISAALSLTLILYSTEIVRKVEPGKWLQTANTYYSDEGIFEYTPRGFTVITKDGKSLNIHWNDILRAESYQQHMNDYLKKSCITIFLSEHDFITVDSTMPGFPIFEKRLKENLKKVWIPDQGDERSETQVFRASRLS